MALEWRQTGSDEGFSWVDIPEQGQPVPSAPTFDTKGGFPSLTQIPAGGGAHQTQRPRLLRAQFERLAKDVHAYRVERPAAALFQ